jgi:NADH:ubiquinone oxidoreductase subunit
MHPCSLFGLVLTRCFALCLSFYLSSSLKHGELKGVDRFGNQYYESARELPGRHRWVVYPSKKLVDASAVPPEWHGWLHHMNDETPLDVRTHTQQRGSGGEHGLETCQ